MSHRQPGLLVDAGDGAADRGVDPGGHAERRAGASGRADKPAVVEALSARTSSGPVEPAARNRLIVSARECPPPLPDVVLPRQNLVCAIQPGCPGSLIRPPADGGRGPRCNRTPPRVWPAVGLDGRGVAVNVQQLAQAVRAGPRLPRPGEELSGDRVELPDVAAGEAAQPRPDRGRGLRRVPNSRPVAPDRSTSRSSIEPRRRASEHHRRDLRVTVGADAARQRQAIGDHRWPPEALPQRRGRQGCRATPDSGRRSSPRPGSTHALLAVDRCPLQRRLSVP